MLSNSSAEATLEVLEEYYRELEGFSLAPLWQVQETALIPEPVSKASLHMALARPGTQGLARWGTHWHSRRRAASLDAP